MSRCFPYPPPGYTLSRASHEALIESIKLQKEREKARAEKKKDKKREKKEKKKDKEEKGKWKGCNLSHDVYGVLQKVGKEESEQLERSGITEELELPVNSQDPSNSSNSTQNSNKRKRHESPSNGCHTGGNILRFRLPFQKHVDFKVSSDAAKISPPPGRTDSSSKYENAGTSRALLDKLHPISLSNGSTLQLVPPGPNKDSNQSTSQQTGNSREKQHDHVSKKCKQQHKAAKKYARIIDCIPSRQPNEIVGYEEDWLCRKNFQGPGANVKIPNQMSCASSCLLWPRAQYLQESDIYALPYSIPF